MKKFSKIIVIALIFILFQNVFAHGSEEKQYKAKIIKDLGVREEFLEDSSGGSKEKYQVLKVKIIDNSELKGKTFDAEYVLRLYDSVEHEMLKEGKKVYVSRDQMDPNRIIITDVDRLPYLLVVFIIFLLFIILIGRWQGVKTIISLGLTFAAIFYVVLPLIIKGYSAIFLAVIACSLIAIVTLILVGGINRKTVVSIVGTISGVIVSAILAITVSKLANITGLSNEDSQMLIYATSGMNIDIKGLFFAGILIGTVGATMDISMSIASAMHELTDKVKSIKASELIKSGLNVGKDAMGTMSNTLILAYVGESINLVLFFMLTQNNFFNVINTDFIASEILRSICGTIGMISAIPITAFIYGVIYYLFDKETEIDKYKKRNVIDI